MFQRAFIVLVLILSVASFGWSQGQLEIIDADDPRLPVPDSPGVINDLQVAGSPAQPNLWIGAGVEPVSDALRAHIDLPVGAGLVVREVVPNGPAAAAGLQQHDVLMSVNDRPLASAIDLVTAVRGSNGEELMVEWLRRGEVLTGEIKPAVRPGKVAAHAQPPRVQASPDAVREWLKALQGGGAAGSIGGNSGLRVQILGGGGSPSAQQRSSVQSLNNLSIQIQKQNDEPAKITVKRDGDSWEVTEDTLDELPDDIRPQVERMVKGNGVSIQLPNDFNGFDFQVPNLPQIGFPNFDERFEQMNQRMEQMMEQMQRIEEQRVVPKPEIELDEA